MVAKFVISPSALTEGFVLKLWEAQSDGSGAEVHTQTISAPHSSPVTITVNGLDRVVHIVRLYGATSGNLLHESNYEPTVESTSIFAPIHFKVGDGDPDTPAAGQPICVTPELANVQPENFLIHRNNYGYLKESIHFSFDDSTGEWELLGGDVFGANEEFTIIKVPSSVTTPVNDSVVGKWFADFVNVSANTNYSNSHLRKLIRFTGSPTYTFQVSDTVPIGYAFVFQNSGTGTAIIKFDNGSLRWPSVNKTQVSLPTKCEACVVWDGTNWNVVYMNQSTWVDGAASPTAGTIMGVGSYNVGDVASGDPSYTITHNLAISGDYMVLFSIETNTAASYVRNNKVCGTWWHHATDKANKFYVSLQEISSETQDVSISWMIVKR